ncbi:hypothetical protein C8F01DRAFT_1098637 [Mycena amicta]|nr:hypothetical protein C8F01DRAFT_1098637 [Mycena amicta]
MAAARAADRSLLHDIEAEIETLQAQIAVLRRERDQVRGRLGEYTYPILTLPNEITTEIFTQYLPPYPDFPPLVGSGSPTFLLGICHLWRSIALHSPRLWRCIQIYHEHAISDDHVKVVQLWLQRSAGSPLSLYFDGPGDAFSEPEGESSLVQTLVAHRSRWQYINFWLLPHQHSSIFGAASSWDRLVHINLSTTREFPLENVSLHNAPLLRSVYLSSVDYDLSSFPWDQLTSLALLDIQLIDIAPILQAATNLLRCKLTIRRAVIADGLHIRLPRLEILSLDALDASGGDDLAVFTLPSLRRIEIAHALLGDPVEQLRSLISRSECQLERLLILDISGPPGWTADRCRIAFPLVGVDNRERVMGSFSHSGDQWEKEDYWLPVTTTAWQAELEPLENSDSD